MSARRGPRREATYELQITDDHAAGPPTRLQTEDPMAVLEPALGVGDAWAVIRAADGAWNGVTGAWVTLHADRTDPPTPMDGFPRQIRDRLNNLNVRDPAWYAEVRVSALGNLTIEEMLRRPDGLELVDRYLSRIEETFGVRTPVEDEP